MGRAIGSDPSGNSRSWWERLVVPGYVAGLLATVAAPFALRLAFPQVAPWMTGPGVVARAVMGTVLLLLLACVVGNALALRQERGRGESLRNGVILLVLGLLILLLAGDIAWGLFRAYPADTAVRNGRITAEPIGL